MSANSYFFAVGNAAFQSTGAIAGTNKLLRLFVVADFVVNFRAGKGTGLSTGADRHRLHRGNRHHGLRESAIELQVPGSVRSETGDNATRHYFKDAAEGVALTFLSIDQLDHALLNLAVRTMQRSIFRNGSDLIESKFQWLFGNSTKLNHVAANLDAKVCEQLFGQSAAGDPRRGLTRRSALQHVTQIARIVFQTAGQIGMTRTRAFDAARFLRWQVAGLRGHYVVPVGPVLVFNHQRQRRAER